MKLRELFSNNLEETIYPGLLWSMEKMQMPAYPEFYDRYTRLEKQGKTAEARRVFEEFAFWINAQHEQRKDSRIEKLFHEYEKIREKEATTGKKFPRARYRVIYAYYKIKLGPLGNVDKEGNPDQEKIKRGQEDLDKLAINPKNIMNEVNLQRKPQRKSAQAAIPGMEYYDYLDNNAHPYMAYRFGLALAPSPNTETMYPRGPTGSDLAIIDYTDADAEIRKGAEKLMGIKPTNSTSKGSEEVPTTYTKSPVAKNKRNQYGV